MRADAITNILLFAALMAIGYGCMVYFDGSGAPPAPPVTPTERPAAGQTAPDFTLKTLDGKTVRLADFRGKIVILNFWATWCPPCVKEFPTLLKIVGKYPDKIVLIAPSSDIDDKSLSAFLDKWNWKRPNAFIGRDADQSITQKTFQTFKLPETFVIDREGRIREKFIGGDWDPAALESLIESL